MDAFIELKKNPALSTLRLRATGGQHGGDIRYVAGLKKKLAKLGLSEDVEFVDDFDPANRKEFIQSLTVLSVPAEEGEAFGMYIPEALAQGVPVVQPNAGGFPEVVQATGGGLLYDIEDPHALVSALESLLLNATRLEKMVTQGREVVLKEYTVERMAKNVVQVYEELV